MTPLPSTPLRCKRRPPARTRLRRVLRRTLYVKLALLVVAFLGCGLFYARLSLGPMNVDQYSARVAEALAERIGPGWSVTLRDTALQLEGGAPAVRTVGLDIRNPQGVLVVQAPYAIVTLDVWSLLTGIPLPRSIELRDMQLRASIARDGSLSLMAAEPGSADANEVAPIQPEHEAEASDPPEKQILQASPVSVAISGLFDMLFQPSSIVGAIDRAQISNARLTLIGADGRERVAFSRMDARFQRTHTDDRLFALDLESPKGRWRLDGEAHRRAGIRRGVLTAANVPVQDLTLLAGLSTLPTETDLRLSGRAEVALDEKQVQALDAHLETSPGQIVIHKKDAPTIGVERFAADLNWDEPRRVLTVKEASYKSGATELRLGGDLTRGAGPGIWRLNVRGRDAVMSGATETDFPFEISTIEGALTLQDGGAVLERLALAGPDLGLALGASMGTPDDQGGVQTSGEVRGTDIRRLLRLWPNNIATDLRKYLLANARHGIVDHLSVRTALNAQALKDAVEERPIPDGSLLIDYAFHDAELRLVDGLPPISGLAARGRSTGRTASIQASRGLIDLGQSRSLALSEGFYTIADLSLPDPLAKIGFRVSGGIDALGALMRLPLLRRAGTPELDPANVAGQADLRVAFGLSVNHPPKPEDVQVNVTGALNNLSVDKAFGRDKLEGANLAVSIDKGALTMRGDGRIGGIPATIEFRQPRNNPGEVVVAMSLDEAARKARGMSLGSQLQGPIGVRVTASTGRPEAKPRVELDLAKASIDNLVPGWTKAAGKPGHMSFVLNNPDGTDLRDVVLESGTVLMRGNLSFTADGTLDKANLSAFRISPNDDMRVQADRSGNVLKTTIRGNMADARPFIRYAQANTGTTKGNARDSRDGHGDIDLDLALNILTGFNNENLTAVSAKAQVRNREVRQGQFTGRFPGAPVSVEVQPRTADTQNLAVQSRNAGATLRFLDIYRRMYGGDMVLRSIVGNGPEIGDVTIASFVLRDEPALQRIIAEQPAAVRDERTGALSRINMREAQFSRLKADFTKNGTRLDFRDAVISGEQVGFTLAGWLDLGLDRTDVAGTFVPAYGLNNVFSQVPVVGMLLGGDQNQGLFGINFRVSGQMSSPTVSVNPLSVVAPGIFRKLFGTGGPGEVTGATTPFPAER